MKRLVMAAVAVVTLAGQALSGPVTDFEAQLRAAYGSYRVALFATNTGKIEQSANAVEAFAGKWNALGDAWGQTPPPQYVDDPRWLETLVEVKRIASEAADEVKAGKLPEAHETLEAIRDELGELHLRNGIVTFSDRTNAYHAAMEEALKMGSDDIAKMHEMAAVLQYLATDMLRFPPPEAKGSAEFAALSEALVQSVANFLDAARSGDPAQVGKARQALKPAYAKLFVKFG
jgi:hypothetical protein